MAHVFGLINELAIYENAPEQVEISVEDLERDGFEDKALFNVLLAENEGEIAGMAFYYYAYSKQAVNSIWKFNLNYFYYKKL